jgi:hypothetical protein
MVRGCGAVKHVAGNDYGIDLALIREPRNTFHDCEPLLAKESCGITFYRAEGLSELPVSGMDKRNRQLYSLFG